LKIAKGRYITFLDADDVWLETKIEEQLSFMKKLRHFPLHNYRTPSLEIFSINHHGFGSIEAKLRIK